MDIYTASMIWKRYLDFEVDEYEDLIETSADETLTKEAKKRIIYLFHRQFSMPLIGNDRLLRGMDRLLSSICNEADLAIIQPDKIQKLFESSKAELESRLVFEDYIQSDSFDSMTLDEASRVKSWKAYIALEINEHKYSRAQRLYERAVLNCQVSSDIWNDYLDFAMTTLKSWPLIADITIRMVKIFKSDIHVWRARFMALEHLNQEDELIKAFSSSMSSWFTSAEDYLSVLFMKTSYYRRKIQRLSETVIELETKLLLSAAILSMRLSSAELEAFMEKYYESWFDGWLKVYLFEISVEDEVVERLSDRFSSLPVIPLDNIDSIDDNINFQELSITSEAVDIWERAVKRFGRNSNIWKEYIHWSRFHQGIETTRKLFKRMISLASDNHLQLYQDWLQFEYQVGGLHDIQTVWAKIRSVTAKETSKIENVKHSAADMNKKKRLVESASTDDQDKTSKKARYDEPNAESNVSDVASMIPDATTQSRELIPKIVVKNLSFNSSVDVIRNHFSSCGELKSVDLLLAKSGRSRGIADITFVNFESVKNALQLHESILDGRPILVEKWTSDALRIAKPASEESLPTDKLTVFVSKISLTLGEDALKEFLVANCGEISDIKLAVDKYTKKSKVRC